MSIYRLAPDAVAAKVIALHGGRAAFLAHTDAQVAELNLRWNQDSALMGLILRSHLFVEYYLGRYLQLHNPSLGDVDDARLSFAQKVDLIDRNDRAVAYLIPGIRRLNKIRNRLAHSLNEGVTEEDRDVFLSVDLFRALRDAMAAPSVPSHAPIDVLESFAQHAGMVLDASVDPRAGYWVEALKAP
ncbi:hypothetical protein [Rhodanobacter aciditrophus]|uniref:hypothetical protein n=1 Tax=Rhodanobacter aciditrophus TaxID=1623218 RepID=UPI003CEA7BCA